MKLTKQQKLTQRFAHYLRKLNRMEPYGTRDGIQFFFKGYPAPAPFAQDYHRKTKNRRKRNR